MRTLEAIGREVAPLRDAGGLEGVTMGTMADRLEAGRPRRDRRPGATFWARPVADSGSGSPPRSAAGKDRAQMCGVATGGGQRGGMLCSVWNRLSGSYIVFTSIRRSRFSA